MSTTLWRGVSGWQLALALGIAAAAGYYLLPTAGVSQAVVLNLVNVFSLGAALRTASRVSGRERVVWSALAAGMALTVLANVPHYSYPLLTGRPLPFPSPVDALWLLTYPCFVVALLSLTKLRQAADQAGNLIEAGIVATSGGMILWAFVLDPVLDAHGLPFLAHVVSVAYPAMDVVLFAVVVSLISGTRGNRNPASGWLLASFAMLFASDTVSAIQLAHGTIHIGGPSDGLRLLSYLLIGVAALHPTALTLAATSHPAKQRMGACRLAFLGTALVVGPILLATTRRDAEFLTTVCMVTILLVLARMALSNWRLAASRKAVEAKSEELRHQALHDGLTGLANRTLLIDRIARSQARTTRTGSATAVLFLDLDGFKNVNDTLGHDAGDQLLRAVADRLTVTLREADTVARLGGDEFVVVIDEHLTGSVSELVAERILKVMREPFLLVGSAIPIVITASVGVAIGPRATPGDLLRDADVALYQAKTAGRDCFAVFEGKMEAAVHRHNEIELDLRGALMDDQFELRYQPIYELDQLTLVGFEALLRWQHPVHGLIGPDEFIPVLEATGQIVDVGRWVLFDACRQMAQWHSQGRNHGISVNVSGRQLDRDTVVEDVAQALEVSGLEPHSLTLEITETTLMRNPAATAGRLRQLKKLGVRIAIDDFGTGYSSLAYLERFPVDCLKIDRAFTEAINRSPESRALLHTLVQLGKDLGLTTLAEGVETAAQLAHLRGEHVGEVQGFLLAGPMTVGDVEAVLFAPAGVAAALATGNAA